MNWPLFTRKLLHDLVNPLSGSKIQLELLQLGASSTEDVIPEVSKHLDQQQLIIEKTRDLITLKAPERVVPLQQAELDRIEERIKKTFPSLSETLPWQDFVGVTLPEDHFRILLEALLENASDQQATKMVVESVSNELFVSDNGNAFSDKMIEDAFTPFYSTKPAGVGLGLNLVAYILELNHGTTELRANGTDKRAAIILKLPR